MRGAVFVDSGCCQGLSEPLRCFPLQPSKAPFPAFSLIGIGGLLLLIGYLVGRLITNIALPAPTISVVPDTRKPVAVLRLAGVRNGMLEGNTVGEVRFFLGDKQILAGSGGTIRADVGSFFVNEVSIVVPEGMQFVASKQGKYYYPVDSSEGERLTPSNRLYFRDAASAEKAGFQPKK